jgi:MSHA pilin protein MshC
MSCCRAKTDSTLKAGRCAGFTLVELVVTMIVIGILAAVVMPRFANRADFDAAGYADQVRASLEYARNSAIASRRNVCVAIAAGALTFTRAAADGDTAACTATLAIPQRGAVSNVLTPPANVAIGGTLAGFTFLARGAASSGGTFTVSGHTVTVVAETGYVY